MSYYFIANIRLRDEQKYQHYLAHAEEIFEKYKGTYLAVDNDPEILEGNWEYDRAVIIRFDKREEFESWYRSEEYQEILKHRLSASDCDTILIKGNSK